MITTGQSALLRSCATAVALSAITLAVFPHAGILINTSASMPLGLYVETANRHAPIVAFCPPEPYASFAIHRGYRTNGSCPDGAKPLMKPIVAHAGDQVELSAEGVAVNGAVIPNTKALTRDSGGRTLTPWKFGRYTVAPRTMWVASSYHHRSYDSRYFGPIAETTVMHYVRPFLTFR